LFLLPKQTKHRANIERVDTAFGWLFDSDLVPLGEHCNADRTRKLALTGGEVLVACENPDFLAELSVFLNLSAETG